VLSLLNQQSIKLPAAHHRRLMHHKNVA